MKLSRALGVLAGQLAGDSLGSLVEFKDSKTIRKLYPEGIRELSDGGVWGTMAGQPTDDSEMALALADSLISEKTYKPQSAFRAYLLWMESKPFDIGSTTSSALSGVLNAESQANGALMRVSPLGIFTAGKYFEYASEWAMEDAALTHPNKICAEINSLYVRAIAYAIENGVSPEELFNIIALWSRDCSLDVRRAVERSDELPEDFLSCQGWVLIAFQNALFYLKKQYKPEEAIIETVMSGGDTDTNAAICGALLGSCFGIEYFPKQWIDCLLTCRPFFSDKRIRRPRPELYHSASFITVAKNLMVHG